MIQKTFSTFLSSQNRFVLKQSKKFRVEKKKIDKVIPKTFNPIDQWGFFLSGIKDQGKCGACWAIASAKTLSDRYSILSVGSILDDLSPYQMIMCQGTILPDIPVDKSSSNQIDLQAHTNGACNGNSLFTAIDFLYTVGCVSTSCVSRGLFKEHGYKDLSKINNPKDVPSCKDVLGENYENCLDPKKAARYYRIIAGYQVDSDPESIKQEIYKWGPVTAGFQVYEDFLNEYDGTTIYMGPKKDSKSIGGHAVEILGWGTEDGVDYWWIANSWGSTWGLGGYFKMKIGIKELELEQNVVSMIPDFPGFDKNMINYDITISPEDIALRKWINIDSETGYKNNAISKIKDGILSGDLTPIFSKKVPDMNVVWLGDVSTEDFDFYNFYINLKIQKNEQIITFKNIFLSLLIITVSYFVGYFFSKIKNILKYS